MFVTALLDCLDNVHVPNLLIQKHLDSLVKHTMCLEAFKGQPQA